MTETEMKEKKARVEDALNATRAAVEEGIVAGGGVALIRCISALEDLKLEGEEQLGVDVVTKALEEPLRKISDNAGVEGAVVLNRVKEGKDAFGYNAKTDVYEDLIEAGVIDPKKLEKENCCIIAPYRKSKDDMLQEILRQYRFNSIWVMEKEKHLSLSETFTMKLPKGQQLHEH